MDLDRCEWAIEEIEMQNKIIAVKAAGASVSKIVPVMRSHPQSTIKSSDAPLYFEQGSEIKITTSELEGRRVRVTCERITLLADLCSAY